MERFLGWIESRTHGNESTAIGGTAAAAATSSSSSCYRPPPLRTSSTYDDDEIFNNTALHMLSRYEALGLSEAEAIASTLICAKQRASFLESLSVRRSRSLYLSPSTASLVKRMDQKLTKTLKAIVVAEENMDGNGNTSSGGSSSSSIKSFVSPEEQQHLPPTAPRHLSGPASSGSTSQGGSNAGVGGGGGSNSLSSKKKKNRRFFPDSDSISGGLFRSRRVQNIDWKLTQAIENVQMLRLDGDGNSNFSGGYNNCAHYYEPPSMR